MKSRLISIVLVIALLFVLTACDQKEEATESTKTETKTEAATEAPEKEEAEEETMEEAEEANLVLFSWAGEGERFIAEAFVKNFQADNPNVTVEENYIPYNDYHSKINTLIAAGQTPDVFIINDFLINEWGENGVAVNLKEAFAARGRDIDEDYLAGALYRSKPENCYGIAWVQGVMYTFYNKEMFEEAGIEPPSMDGPAWTFEKATEVAKQLTKDINGNTPNDADFDPDNVVVYGTVNSGSTHWAFLEMSMRTAGVRFSRDGETWELFSDKGCEAIQLLADMSLVHHCAPPLEIQRGTFSNPLVNLMNGQVAMIGTGSFGYSFFKDEGFDAGIAKPFIFSEENFGGGGAPYAVGSDSKYPEAALDLLIYFTSFKNQIIAAEEQGLVLSSLPADTELFDNPELLERWYAVFDKDLADMSLDMLLKMEDPQLNSTIKGLAEAVETKIAPSLDRVWLGEVTAKELGEELAPEIEGTLGGIWGQ